VSHEKFGNSKLIYMEIMWGLRTEDGEIHVHL
jgi:hypothetical protein